MLEGKVVLVTGAGNGIGAETAKLAAKEGAKVVVNDLGSSQFGVGADTSPAQRVVDEIRASGGEAVPSFHSVAAWESAHAIVDDAVKAYGRLDVVVNNAGVLRDTMFHKMTDEDWQTVIGVTSIQNSAVNQRILFRRDVGGRILKGLCRQPQRPGIAADVGRIAGNNAVELVGISKSLQQALASTAGSAACAAPERAAAVFRFIGSVRFHSWFTWACSCCSPP